MNARLCLVLMGIAAASFAQSDQKFQIYGFADMTVTKYFPKENSVVRNVDRMDERLQLAFDHINLYQDFKPNDRLRFLTEFSFQGEPVYHKGTNGSKTKMFDFVTFQPTETVMDAQPEDSNQTMKGIVKYEWGSFSLERALFSVNVNQHLNFSFGKFITPAGIWNVDHGSPVIMTVNQPSQYSFREMYPKSQLGIMENGVTFIGDLDLSYNLYVSSGRNDPTINNISDMAVGGQLRLGVPVLDECNIGLTGYTGAQTVVYRYGVMDFTKGPTMDFSVEDNQLFKYREGVGGVDFRIRKSIFMLQSEFNYLLALNKMRDDSASHIFATYVLASADIYKAANVMITPYGYWEFVKYKDTKNNPSLFSGVIPEAAPTSQDPNFALGYMKVMAGLNMKLLGNFGIKLEYNWTRLLMADIKYDMMTFRPISGFNDIQKDEDKLYNIPGVAAQFYIQF